MRFAHTARHRRKRPEVGGCRMAFTLIELLVVIGIIAILVSLMAPAVQRIRDAAARAQCSNNLRQIGLALHQYHDASRIFPPGMRWQKGKDQQPLASWMIQILPYIEQQGLWNLTQEAYRKSPRPFNNPPHIGLATVMPLFVCPSDGRGFNVQFAARDKFNVGLTNYLGVEGLDLNNTNGMLYRDSRVRMADVTDGLSNTLLVGERPPSPDFQFGWWYAGVGQRHTGSCDSVLGVQEQHVGRIVQGGCSPGTYSFVPGSLGNPCDMYHFWSTHIGGAHFLFADGSVHFVGYGAAPLLPALASRAGGEVAQLPD
jgi:prepilin-type N-terminal cleavage/methylation domain-containing protein/prepilin-type processing-associated H-X9-DG protein